MKTFSQYIKTITEAYHDLIVINNKEIPIFVNPDSKEIRQAMSEFGRHRWAANSTSKRLYLWTSEETHSEILTHLQLKLNSPKVLYGQAKSAGNKIEITQMDQPLEFSEKEKIQAMSYDWRFLTPYISNLNYLEQAFGTFEKIDLLKEIKKIISDVTTILNQDYKIERNDEYTYYLIVDDSLDILFNSYTNQLDINAKISSDYFPYSTDNYEETIATAVEAKVMIVDMLLRLKLSNLKNQNKYTFLDSVPTLRLGVTEYAIDSWNREGYENRLQVQ
jgi:hypothetical protein